MAEYLGRETVLIDIGPGPATIAASLAEAADTLGCDQLVFIDVGGDVLADGDEPGLRSPLCDAVMLAAAGHLVRAGRPVLLGIFGIGCDAELRWATVVRDGSQPPAPRRLRGGAGTGHWPRSGTAHRGEGPHTRSSPHARPDK